MMKVKSFLPKSIRENNINILEVDEHLDELSEYIRNEVNSSFESYGLLLPEFYVTNIDTPDSDPAFKRLKQQHAERYLKIQEERIRKAEAEARKDRILVETETDAEVKIVGVKAEEEATRRMAYADAEKIRAKGLAKAEIMKAQGFTYAQETQRQIGVGIAENEGGGSAGGAISGVVQAGVGIGVAVAVGKQTVDVLKDVMSDSPSSAKPNPPTEPAPTPPLPTVWECPQCGTADNDGNFCKNCGSKRG